MCTPYQAYTRFGSTLSPDRTRPGRYRRLAPITNRRSLTSMRCHSTDVLHESRDRCQSESDLASAIRPGQLSAAPELGSGETLMLRSTCCGPCVHRFRWRGSRTASEREFDHLEGSCSDARTGIRHGCDHWFAWRWTSNLTLICRCANGRGSCNPARGRRPASATRGRSGRSTRQTNFEHVR